MYIYIVICIHLSLPLTKTKQYTDNKNTRVNKRKLCVKRILK